MFSRCGRVIKGQDSIGPAEAAAMLRAAADGVQQRGKAALGEKTVLDALIPAAEAFGKTLSEGQDLASCLAASLSAAQTGAEGTIGMRSRAGRSSWLGERTVGAKDPGAAAFVLMLASAQRYVAGSGGEN
jgi:dihydroxyacetone kinase-like protein